MEVHVSQSLPPKPSLEHLKKQAKDLLSAHHVGEQAALDRVSPYFPTGSEFSLTQAQFVLAREYGFSSWHALSVHVDGAEGTLDEFLETALGGQIERANELWHSRGRSLRLNAMAAATAGDVEALRSALGEDPSLVGRTFGKEKRPLLCYTCFSRLFADPEFEQPLLDSATFLIAQGADPNGFWIGHWAGEEVRETALYGAAGVLNHADLTKVLLDSGADPNEGLGTYPPYRGEAVYHACDHPGHNECLRLLFEAGASQAAKDYCILRKLDFEDIEGVKLFLEHGSNPNMGVPRTALSHALLRGRSFDMLRLLLDHGADPNGRDADGSTPYVLARRYGNQEGAALLVDRGANSDLKPYDQILAAAADGNIELVKTLALSHPEVLEEFSEYGRQPNDGATLGAAGSLLHDLARAGQADGLRALISVGFDPGARNHFNETPLHWACVAGRLESARVLIEAGAPLDVKERNHQADPIGWACWGSVFWQEPHGDYAATVRLLLDRGARVPNAGDGSTEVQEAVRERGAK